jgi:hypothetical protein
LFVIYIYIIIYYYIYIYVVYMYIVSDTTLPGVSSAGRRGGAERMLRGTPGGATARALAVGGPSDWMKRSAMEKIWDTAPISKRFWDGDFP